MVERDLYISLVTPVHSAEGDLISFLRNACQFLGEKFQFYEVVIVVNGPTEELVRQLKEIGRSLGSIRVITLSRIVSEEEVYLAMLEHCAGDLIVTMNWMTDPILSLERMVELASSGNDIVSGLATNRRRKSTIMNFISFIYYFVLTNILRLNVERDWTLFCCMNRKVVNAIIQNPGQIRFYKALRGEIGFSHANLNYVMLKAERESFRNACQQTLQGIEFIFSASSLPLFFVSTICLVAGTFSMVFFFYVIISKIVVANIEGGWSSLAIATSLLSGCLFLAIGIIAQYLSLILKETIKSSRYFVSTEFKCNDITQQLQNFNVSR